MAPDRLIVRLEMAYAAIMSLMAVGAALLTAQYAPLPDWYQLAGFTLAALLLGSRAVRVSDTIGSVSVGFIFVFAALVELGPFGGLVAGVASAIGGTLLCPPRGWRPRPIVAVTAISNISLAAMTAGWAYVWLDRSCTEMGLTTGILPAFIIIGVYYGINSIGVALMASPQAERPPLSIWSDNLSWTVLPFYFGGAVVALVHLAALVAGPLLWLVLIPVTLVVHLSLEWRTRLRAAATAARTAESE